MDLVERYGVPDVGPRADLLGLAEMAAELCAAPCAMIAYVDEDHEVPLATVGFTGGLLPRARSVGDTVVEEGTASVVADLQTDPRFRDRLVPGGVPARFYAAFPLAVPGDDVLGTLSVFGPEPLQLSEAQRRALTALASRVVNLLVAPAATVGVGAVATRNGSASRVAAVPTGPSLLLVPSPDPAPDLDDDLAAPPAPPAPPAPEAPEAPLTPTGPTGPTAQGAPSPPAAQAASASPVDPAARWVADERRVADIEHFGLPDLGPRPDLDALAEAAMLLAGARGAVISYVDDKHEVPLAAAGPVTGPVPLEGSLVTRLLRDGGPWVVDDVLTPGYEGLGLATDQAVRFAAVAPLVVPRGEAVGALVVHDTVPGSISEAQHRALGTLADQVVDVLVSEVRTRELEGVVAELGRSNDMLAAFAGQVSHDLRNPLGAVAGSLEVLADVVGSEPVDRDRVDLLVGRTSRAVDRMIRLVDTVLDLAVVDGRLTRHEVDVAALVTDVREDLAAELEGAQVNVGELHAVVADPVQLRIVVQNLLSNAAKFTREGEPPRIDVDTELHEDVWRLVIADRGVGIAAEDRDRAFEVFVRLDPSVPGAGVGLATCRRIAEAHGGTVAIADRRGGGTVVRVELPR